MIRTLIAEDSVTIRELLEEVLRSDPQIEVIGIASNGREAIEMTHDLSPDVVVMDINMPEIDGFEATKQIMIEAPTPIVIVSATMDIQEINVSMAALNAGALTLLSKPTSVGSANFEECARRLVSNVKAMAGVKVIHHWRPPPPIIQKRIAEEPPPPGTVEAIAIAASTGGPAALGRILSELPPDFTVPVLIVQHIATGFIDGLAAWLNTLCSLKIRVATNGELLKPSTVYLASDGMHMGVTRNHRLRLEDTPPVRGFRPSASYLFESIAAVFGNATIALMLTGMGQDGVEGLRAVRNAGGRIIVQDEESSVVFGMPKAAMEAGLADTVLPVTSIGSYLVRMVITSRQTGNRAWLQ